MSTVLVVEDSNTQRQLITDFLKSNRFAVTIARNGSEALACVQFVCPDVVLLDIVMPDMNGYDVCRRLKTNPKTQKIPVIFCSMKCSEVDRYWGAKIGADAYIGKPFQKSELLGAIQQLLHNQR